MSGFISIEHRGEARQIEIRRQNYGKPENPVLVFLHEGLGCIASWKELPGKISRATGCNALTYSRLGYGGSDPVTLPRKPNFMHVEALDILPRVLAAAGIKEYILLGHSDGGSIGVIHAGSPKSKGLRGLVTLAAHLFCEPVTLAGIRNAKDLYLNKNLKSRLMRIHGENTDTAFWGWNDTWLSPGFAHWNIERYLKPIRVPVLAIQGDDDPYGTRAQLDAVKTGITSCTTHLIENCGHIPHMEQQESVLNLMIPFIRSCLHQLP
ncbi:MAG: alpha/beta hydrolase [Desulfobacterales bacterium]|nr:alpha/beta hydrolase [Desulfobacterales bacterium]